MIRLDLRFIGVRGLLDMSHAFSAGRQGSATAAGPTDCWAVCHNRNGRRFEVRLARSDCHGLECIRTGETVAKAGNTAQSGGIEGTKIE